MEKPASGSAERELATPESAVQSSKNRQAKAPSAKEAETEGDQKLPEDQQAMQPDSS